MLARRADPLVIVMRPRQQTRTSTTTGVSRPWDRDSWAAVIGGNKMTPIYNATDPNIAILLLFVTG